MKILIKNCSIMATAKPKNIYKVGQVEIKGNIIGYIGAVRGVEDDFDRIIDGSGMVALPGFVNSHTHSAMSLMRGYGDDMGLMEWLKHRIWPIEEGLSDEDVYWGALLSIAEMLKSGTTAFADMYFFMDEVAKAVMETGIRADLSIGLVSTTGDWQERLDECKRFFTDWNKGADGRINVSLGPHAPYTCAPEFLRRVSDLAAKLESKVHIHLAETLDELKQIKEGYGKTPIEYALETGILRNRIIGAHCVHLSDRDMEIMKEYNVSAVHNPQSNMKLASGISPVQKMLDLGINVALGTDSSCSNNNLDMIGEMRSAALLQKVGLMDAEALPADYVLDMATKNGAKALGIDDKIGMLKEGMGADLILIDLDKPHLHPQHDLISNVVYSANGGDVAYTIVDGKILLDKGHLTTMDEERIFYEVGKKIKSLFNR